VIELSRAVLAVNPSFESVRESFKEATGYPSVLDHPDVKVRVEDGRNFVLGTREKYDVIHVGGFHPVITSGAAGFYSVDFYRDCQRLLTPDGYFSQWLPIHDIPHEDFKTILLSFRRGFPYAYIWHKETSDYCMLLGALKPLQIDFQDFERRFNTEEIKDHLKRCNVVNAFDLLDSFLMDGDTIERICGDVPLQTDRHPGIEYHKFRTRDSDTKRNLKMLADGREPVLPYLQNVPPGRREAVEETLDRWFRATNHLLRAQYGALAMERMTLEAFVANFARAAEDYRAAIEINPDDLNAKLLYGRAVARYEVGLSSFYYDMGDREQAFYHAQRAAEIAPNTMWGATARFLLESTGTQLTRTR
jgi:tetratricopeptide (TPR) repeat protein